ncbi:hypothetical protein CO057_04355 [Candidatus Uhrbacteria bacterium CG_4_9_14_0_2_um_filter_41_50]|uniref:Ribosomal RNA large subunit methyltransferase K/L-like methyltransferase domain-containing protein n=1 Tax=Candidatus Uhrbacteria bacterium CG_4_9_14_0_2_um_filter_41_50 TaxID=1975031 RepID=A0A2M8EN11_9BACT|nr:MAG: hypothetical protein COZ45_01610 [Candidatus Uhrbacteria bacterium CG_4_10_14_3_um_filter_41_21]PIZ55152.1 MAG: hypothetical protein COY24_01305 [Candidatus Uhrbacteria bacterium CG_4_10_14_0_2_um_filter_41_21]PJB84859.1 MAG: hypothetical protein CO086_01160 [Candidatus Uhrbacteria bacterium CG_4_9_14_0_8_um_filter_41_16]PJC24119.1 MAG: hypothetical protein CO057_04355 [Candidatus Uhrbacteria bacterium CG_4_9_14_0_2_um_filter_41_50]PJE75008.1 MAG: hypothetical protein COV03_02225 [Candi
MHFSILGIHPELSCAELKAVIGANLSFESKETALFEFGDDLNELQKTLGGASKLGEILEATSDSKDLESILLKHLLNQPDDKKLRFGISVYDAGGTSFSKNLRRENQKLGLALKKKLKEKGRSVRLVTSTEPTLSSVVVAKNKLTTNGIEFCLLVTETEIYIGQTKTYQDFENWSHRDYDRPRRNAKNGMLPPKLARMMVNLSSLAKAQPQRLNLEGLGLLDPFCGSGTVLMEAAMLGYKNLIGSDISKMILEDAKANLDWLTDQGIEMPDYQLIEMKAEKLKLENPVDIIVTEPFLGTPREGKESQITVERQVKDLEMLYNICFSNLAKLMKPGAILVLAAPVHKIKEEEYPLAIENILGRISLLRLMGPIRYEREGQFVGRDIWVFTKN